MALTVITDNPANLLALIKTSIDDGDIKTWSYDEDGDFTHCVDQWENEAWLRPFVTKGKLSFGILFSKNTNSQIVVYGIYHGRFIEMLLTHFDSKFSLVNASALLTDPDIL